MFDLLDKGKSAVLNTFKEVKEGMSKEVKENIITVTHQAAYINKKVDIIERYQVEILDLKNTVMKMKIC